MAGNKKPILQNCETFKFQARSRSMDEECDTVHCVAYE